MKRLFILMLALGMASSASAGIVVVAPDPTSGSIQTDPIDVVQPMQALFWATAGPGTISPTLHYITPLSEVTDYTGADPDLTAAVDYWIAEYAAANDGFEDGPSTGIYFAAFYDSTDPPAPVVGQLITFDVSGYVEVYLLDPDLATGVFSAVAIPEPATIALLGLGGLTLLRKRI